MAPFVNGCAVAVKFGPGLKGGYGDNLRLSLNMEIEWG
jgi:hypothetical protein